MRTGAACGKSAFASGVLTPNRQAAVRANPTPFPLSRLKLIVDLSSTDPHSLKLPPDSLRSKSCPRCLRNSETC
jgi:hypothetical protein